jgi:hypothetical protein
MEDSIIDIQINTGGEFLYFYKVQDWSSIQELNSMLEILFHSGIHEELVFCDGKLVQAKYSVKNSDMEFSSVMGNCFFGKKTFKITEYEPWMN